MKKVLFMSFVAFCFQLSAQNRLTIHTNLMRDSDTVSMQQMEYSQSGDDGENIVWDFSNIDTKDCKHPVIFCSDSTNRISKIEDNSILTYQLFNDTIKQIRAEDRLNKSYYDCPKLTMKYPFQYGDSVSGKFSCHGRYCGNHFFGEKGMTVIHADGYGKLILSDKETLNNVLRVCTVTSRSIAMDMDSTALDTAKLKQEIVEQYDWYARGYRYPLYETVQRTSYSNLTPVASARFAYRILPDSMSISADIVNDSIRQTDSVSEASKKAYEEDVIHYAVSRNGNTLSVDYTLDKDATIVSLISDSMGIIHRKTQRSGKAGEQDSISFDCSGLRRGQYVLYINVNGKVYNEKVNI